MAGGIALLKGVEAPTPKFPEDRQAQHQKYRYEVRNLWAVAVVPIYVVEHHHYHPSSIFNAGSTRTLLRFWRDPIVGRQAS